MSNQLNADGLEVQPLEVLCGAQTRRDFSVYTASVRHPENLHFGGLVHASTRSGEGK